MIKYRTCGYGESLIEAVEITKETNSFVFVGNDRYEKRANYYNFFDSWEDAKAFLIKKAEKKVGYCSYALEVANSELGNIRGLKQPV